MSGIVKLKDLQKAEQDAAHWIGLIGNAYRGGGGGVGRLQSVSIKAEVYHQPRDGDNNYHAAPKQLASEIEDIVKHDFDGIVKRAMNSLRTKVDNARTEAIIEYKQMLSESGVHQEELS